VIVNWWRITSHSMQTDGALAGHYLLLKVVGVCKQHSFSMGIVLIAS